VHGEIKPGSLANTSNPFRFPLARADQTERCVSQEALLGSFVPDVLNLTMPCFIYRRAAEKDDDEEVLWALQGVWGAHGLGKGRGEQGDGQ
jgi:hypothetical protein